VWRLRPAVLIGAAWALLSAFRVRRQLRKHGLRREPLRPPRLPRSAGPGVRGALTRLAPTCLERALVQQAWLVSQGEPRDVVIGVLSSGLGPGDAAAHAWVDGTDPSSAARYVELHRIPPSGR
jgi:hypothetical protein